jgi:hypothetical protein
MLMPDKIVAGKQHRGCELDDLDNPDITIAAGVRLR